MKSRQLPCVTEQIQSESDVTDNSFRLLLPRLFIDASWWNRVHRGLWEFISNRIVDLEKLRQVRAE